MSKIQEYFNERTVLVTGATGFLGKAIVEKILRSLPDLRRLYVLIRPQQRSNRSISALERFESEVLSSSIFDRLRRERGDDFDAYVDRRVTVLAGDLTDGRFGLSEDDHRRLAAEVEVIINSAAVVVFDERLDLSLELNSRGARRMLDFARACPRLQAVIHISTCYVSGTARGRVNEEVIPLPFDVDAEVQRLADACAAVKQQFPAQPDRVKDELVKLGLHEARARGWHDTYTFTKALGEQMIVQHRGDLPVVILRPSIIESTFLEPEPGWIDGFRMADPLFVGYGKGYLQDFPGRPDTIADLIPCDFVVNAILACTPRCAIEGGLTIYQVATGEQNPVHFRILYESGRDYFQRNPLVGRDGQPIPIAQWTWPDAASYRRKIVRRYRTPVALAETLLRPFSFLRSLDRQRKRLALRRAALDLLLYYIDIYSPYTSIESRYSTANTAQLWAWLPPEDQRLFPFDPGSIDWRDYIGNVHIPGLKRNVLNLAVEETEPGRGVPVRTIRDLLERSADRYPDTVALQMKRGGEWVRYTYAEVERRVHAASETLLAQGIGRGDTVLLYADNQPEWGIAYLAAVSLGAVVVPTDRQLREADVLSIARFVEARAILASESSVRSFSDQIRTDPTVPPLLNINAGGRPFHETSEPARTPETNGTAAHVHSLACPDDVASILFTTGVNSSDPRAVMLTHRNFLSNVMGVVQLLPAEPHDHFLSVLPLHHALEFTGGFLVPLYVGATITYCDTMRSQVLLDTMHETQATCLIGVPRVFQILHDALREQVGRRGRLARWWFDLKKLASKTVAAATGRNLGRLLFASVHQQLGGRLRAFISGGAALAPQILEEFTAMGLELCEGYGLTETAPIVTVNPLRAARKGSVGVPLPGVEVRILDPDARGVGEIAVRGPNLTVGYFRNLNATERALGDGWLHSGDLGHLDRDGYLHLTGRIKDIIVTPAGKNVYPEEVEQLYGDLPGVRQLCIIGLWDEHLLGEAIHAVVVPEQTDETSLRQTIKQRSRSMPTYQRIQHIHMAAVDLPRTLTGAVDRPRVKQQLVAQLRLASRRSLLTRPTGDDDGLAELLNGDDGVPSTPSGPSHLLEPIKQRVNGRTMVVAEPPETAETPAGAWGRVLGTRSIEEDEYWLRAGPGKRAVRRVMRQAMWLYARAWFGFEVCGIEHLPAGAFIVAANHCSHLDTGAVVTAFGDRGSELSIMGARDYFFNRRLKGWFFHTFLSVVPFDRTENMIKGLRQARAVLLSGRPVLIFPEGTRSLTGELQPFKAGIGLLALELGLPVVPCCIAGTHAALPKGRAWPRRTKIRVSFAPPITMEDYRALYPQVDRRELYRRVADDVRSAVELLRGKPVG
jgi:long-chain acyl-CoA synthetase